MTDVHNKATRSRNMSAIRGKDTKPELQVRRLLHARGFRYSLKNRHLPGNPDIVLPKYRAVVFVHGCFWHLHDCPAFHWPASRADWWKEKLTANQARDQRNIALLLDQGWRVAVVWECALRGKYRLDELRVAEQLSAWLRSGEPEFVIRGSA